jgi:hypothetical protein
MRANARSRSLMMKIEKTMMGITEEAWEKEATDQIVLGKVPQNNKVGRVTCQ